MAASREMTAFRDKLAKRFGDRLTTPPRRDQYKVISTGSITLDVAMRTGGWVQGRTHEIVGPPGVAKTTMSILAAVEHQKALKKAVGWVDMEQSFDFEWARSLGLDTSERMFTHIYPDDSEDVSDLLSLMAQSALYGLIVVDSIGGMESRKAFEKNAEDVVMGKNAQVITRMVKRAAALARQNGITVIYVNQNRANLSGMGGDIAAGPKALQYNTTTSIKLSRKGGAAAEVTRRIKRGKDDDEVGRLFFARVQRSRVSPAGLTADFWLANQATSDFGPIGIDQVDEAVSVGLQLGVIKRGGAMYVLPGDETAIKGREKVVQVLRGDPKRVALIRTEALKLISSEVRDEDDEITETVDQTDGAANAVDEAPEGTDE